jgi:hypothetical protein
MFASAWPLIVACVRCEKAFFYLWFLKTPFNQFYTPRELAIKWNGLIL